MKLTYNFLKSLKKNNDRVWFNNHKDEYKLADEEFKTFVGTLADRMKAHDNIEDYKIFRIYRDVRFSNNKIPYNIHRSCSFSRATDALRGGYYLRIEPGHSVIAGGFWGPTPQDLLHIRRQIDQDPEPLKEILHSKSFKAYFNELIGDQIKTTPKGFTKDNPNIDLLRYKQYLIKHDFSDEEVLASDFPHQIDLGFQNMRPFFDYMSEILTTDLNGEMLVR